MAQQPATNDDRIDLAPLGGLVERVEQTAKVILVIGEEVRIHAVDLVGAPAQTRARENSETRAAIREARERVTHGAYGTG